MSLISCRFILESLPSVVSFLFFGRIIAEIKIANGARKCLLSFGIKPRFIDAAPSPFF